MMCDSGGDGERRGVGRAARGGQVGEAGGESGEGEQREAGGRTREKEGQHGKTRQPRSTQLATQRLIAFVRVAKRRRRRRMKTEAGFEVGEVLLLLMMTTLPTFIFVPDVAFAVSVWSR